MSGVCDLDEAERWYRRSLDLRPPEDAFGRARSLGQLGAVAYERFKKARAAQRPADELASHLSQAAQLYEQALKLLPATAVTDLGTIHNQLGNVYDNAGNIDRALDYYRQAIRYAEAGEDLYSAGETRSNVALTLLKASQPDDARAYAEAALDNFGAFGDRAAADIEKTKKLIAFIDQKAQQEGG